VIGGSGGAGSAVALEFARAGCDVALTYLRREGRAQEVAAAVRALGRRASVHQLAIGDAAAVESAVTAAVATHHRLHTVVVGAGTLATQVLLAEMTREQWHAITREDLDGFFNVMQSTLHRFRAWGGGSYVHLGSAGHLAWPERDGMSVAPKAAIEALITGIAREEGRHGIRANSVLLGVIEAGMFLELSRQGVDLMVTAVDEGQLEERALAVAYGNLATMHAEQGDEGKCGDRRGPRAAGEQRAAERVEAIGERGGLLAGAAGHPWPFLIAWWEQGWGRRLGEKTGGGNYRVAQPCAAITSRAA
jgi:NAD(P)-dependent dehydrogenase (short-subunit alcohol dehydrogenase family)